MQTSNLVGLFLTFLIGSPVQHSEGEAALRLVQDFVAAVEHHPDRAKDFAVDGASIGFGDFAGSRSIEVFANNTTDCELRSITQPPVAANWKLDGARYFRVVWRCPPPYGSREGPDLTVDLFVKEKIVAGTGRYTE